MVELSRRRLLFHGATVFLLALLMGLPLAAQVGNPRGWMAAHVTSLVASGLVMLTGLAWRDVRLSERATQALWWLAVLNGYVGVAAGVLSAVVGIPGPVATGTQPTSEQMLVLAPFLVFLTFGGIAWALLLAIGLDGPAQVPADPKPESRTSARDPL